MTPSEIILGGVCRESGLWDLRSEPPDLRSDLGSRDWTPRSGDQTPRSGDQTPRSGLRDQDLRRGHHDLLDLVEVMIGLPVLI